MASPLPDTDRHRAALTAFAERDYESAAALLTELLGDRVELLNDLAVIRSAAGHPEAARSVLETCLVIDPDDAVARDNLEALGTPASWRRSSSLGGADPGKPERAYPGMQYTNVMAEHALRYSFASTRVGGLHVLDLGCGTGYGSEILTWTAASVRGYDLWRPAAHELPTWPGGAVLSFGHDLCAEPLPRADAAVMFEVLEHLADGPAALRQAWTAVDLLILSFPNPVYHGSHHNPYHVNDWPLERVEWELADAAAPGRVSTDHYCQRADGLIVPGRDAAADYWILVARVGR